MSLNKQEEQRVREIVRLTLDEIRPEIATLIGAAVTVHTTTCGLQRQNRELRFGMKALAILFGTGAVAGFFGSALTKLAILLIQAMTIK
ncbi:MAG: hypothetical protein ABSA97_07410 [Verrucomicrobiia bacterium]